jgi:hypothetical protein
VTTPAIIPRADAPPYGISAPEAATVIRALGARLIDVYSAVADGSSERRTNPWGSKQREQLLRALIDRVALHARTFENAALSATETALAMFAREQFKKDGGTRSQRDRKPIEKNLDKVVGGWLRRFGRRLRQNVVIVTSRDVVDLRDHRGEFRLTLTFEYPWRLVTNRRLQITAKLEAFEAPGVGRVLPFPSNAVAEAVALPQGRTLRPEEARAVAGMFEHMKDLAAAFKHPALADFAEQGLQMFTPRLNVRKTAATILLLVALGAAASPPGQKFVARVVDAIVSSGSLREMIEKLRVDRKEGVFVTPDGAQSQVAQSGSGSEIRVSPGPSPELMHIEASVSGKDLSELAAQMVPLGDIGRVGVSAFQYRSAPEAAIVPWIIEVAAVPEQDAELAAELARQRASVSITYDPPLEKPELTRVQNISLSGKRITFVSELRELPHKRQSYAITATVVREAARSLVYRAQLHVDENGFATLERDRGRPLTPVTQDVKVGHPICTTILPAEMLPLDIPGQTDYVWALAKPFEEQKAMLIVYPLSTHPAVNEITVDWGDGGKATHELEKGIFTSTHLYRVGDRAYPITIYFKGSDVVYKFDLYVFRARPPAQGPAVLDYVTPYPPNPEVTDLAQVGPSPSGMAARMRPGPVKTESITYSRHRDLWVWNVPMDWRTADHIQVRYLWRVGDVIQLPSR